jgi:hypothetical protein
MLIILIERLQANNATVHIVVSSAWREHGCEDDVINKMFANHDWSSLIVGRTPINNDRRGEQIAQWLEITTSSSMTMMTRSQQYMAITLSR